eukprot:scaffold28550_cov41-Attheya_sp.AAC.1
MDLSAAVCWDGDEAARKSRCPLILHDAIAGRSVARAVAPLPRPEPFAQTAIFAQRYERELNISSQAGLGNSLNPDSDRLEAIIEARQRKRAQMAIEKSSRVTDALGTLSLGGGKGRTITSSLMGPGGTERTGRPSRHSGSSLAHDAEYIEQLELVYNHTIVKPDLRITELRQFHRPRLTYSVVRIDRPWQFQIRVARVSGKKGGVGANRGGASAAKADGHHVALYHAAMMGGGATSQAKIRNESDLSPSEGSLVLLEYVEERPPLQLSKGMAVKIVNYYRGDRSRCPISAGGGDRPTRKKRTAGDSANHQTNNAAAQATAPGEKVEKPPRLLGPNQEPQSNNQADGTIATNLIGLSTGLKKKKAVAEKKAKENKPALNVLPEGVTEILHPKVHGPFIGEVEDGTTQTGLITNMFAAPMFRHDAEPTDFLMVLGKKPSSKHTGPAALGVVLRPLPANTFTVGQIEPRIKVFAHNTTGEKHFSNLFTTYHIAKALTKAETKEDCGLRFEEVERLFPHTMIQSNALRGRLKQVASYDKNTQIWTTKVIGYDEDDYPGVEALGRRFSPEGVAANESAGAAVRRLCDLGINQMSQVASSVTSVAAAMVYLNGQLNAARERKSKMSKMVAIARSSKNNNTKSRQVALYERASSKLEAAWKEIRRKQEVARFIYEELQLAPWHLTAEFIDVHKNGQGTAMMRLTGLGDPSGLGEAYNFLRELDSKPNKATGNSDGALNAQIKKITGTQNDLRKLTMKQMASLLRSYGMGQKEIDKLKRWDRVHVIRDLSTKAASDGMGDGLERYARGEKMKLSDQKQMYRERIQEIWRRQRAALATDASELMARIPVTSTTPQAAAPTTADGDAATTAALQKQMESKDGDGDSDSDSEDDDFAAEFEEDMLDVHQTNQIVAAHVRGDGGGEDGESAGGAALSRQMGGDTQDLSKDARELAALKRQREEERAAQEGLLSKPGAQTNTNINKQSMIGRKVIRRRITKIHQDGTQTTTFKFIVDPHHVDRLLAKKKKDDHHSGKGGKDGGEADGSSKKKTRKKTKKVSTYDQYDSEKRATGHSMFEEEDEMDFALFHRSKPGLKFQLQKSTRVVTTGERGRKGGRSSISGMSTNDSHGGKLKAVRAPKLHLGKLKDPNSLEKRKKKRKIREEEADLYKPAHHRKGTSNRRERGAARERMPHVILADRIEMIRSSIEKRPKSGPFQRPVNRRHIPRYYEVISEPTDLQTIGAKTSRYEYKTAALFLRDLELMKSNAIKYNGPESELSKEAIAIYEFAKDTVEQNRSEFDSMEQAVKDQLGGGRKKQKKSSMPKSQTSMNNGRMSTANLVVDGISTTVNIGDEGFAGRFGDDSDSDDSD